LALLNGKPGGLDLSGSCLDWDSRSWHWQRAGLDSRENLDTFKKLVSTIEISRSRLRYLNLVSMAICKSSTSRSRSRLIKTCRDFCDYLSFLWISQFFLDLDWDIMYFYKYLDRDFSSQPYLLTFCASKLASKWAKSVGNSNIFEKVLTKILIISKNHGYLDLSRWSRLVSTISIKISMQPSLDWKVSKLKILTEKKKFQSRWPTKMPKMKLGKTVEKEICCLRKTVESKNHCLLQNVENLLRLLYLALI
jgi:hypothetical protein